MASAVRVAEPPAYRAVVLTNWQLTDHVRVRAPHSRFPTKHHFAVHTGTAPLEASSGQVIPHRLSRAGDRKLNHALYMMAMVQVRRPSAGQAYYRRKLAEGKSPKEALRCLKRRLSDAVDRCLPADQRLPPSPGGIRAGASTEDGAASATCRRPGAAGARPTRRSTPGASRQCPCGAATRER
jgi:transposase